jgi:glutamate-1-semialdehyde 2,1-aminomutase
MNLILNEGYEHNKKITITKGAKIKIKNSFFLDLSNCAGALLLGHNSKVFKKSLNKIISNKISNYAAPNIYAENLSKYLKKIFPNFDKFIFCNSGSEAIIKTLRIVRSISEKKIVSVEGSWHGSVDQFLYQKKGKNKFPLSTGLNNFYKKNLIFIPYNNIQESKKILEKNKKIISSVFIEPIQGCLPNNESQKYLKFIYNFCRLNNILLIFDEIITGLRTTKGSVHKKYNIKPSIVTLGKCIGGGMPIGVIGLSKKVLIKLKEKKVFFGGTYSGNSISTLVGYDLVKHILNRKNIIQNLNKKAERIETEINTFLFKNKIKVKIYRFESILRIVFSDKKILNRPQRDFLEKKINKKKKNFYNFLYKQKIYTSTSGLIFISDRMKNIDINQIIFTFKKAFLKYFN